MTLKEWIASEGIDREAAAALFRTSKRHLDALCARARAPGGRLILRIHEATKGRVTVADLQPVEKNAHTPNDTRSAAA